MGDPHPLAEALASLMDSARVPIAGALTAAGQALTVTEQRLTVTPNEDGTGARSGHVLVDTNVLNTLVNPNFSKVLVDWLGDARRLATTLAQAFPEHVPIPIAFPPPGFDLAGLSYEDLDRADPAEWILGYMILAATHWYLTRLPSVSESDADLSRQLADDLLGVLTTGNVMARQVVAVEGLVPEADLLVCGPNRLRALSPLERGDLMDVPRIHRGGAGVGGVPNMFFPSHILEMDRDAGQPNDIGALPIPRLPLALQLHGVTWSGPGGVATYLLPEWLSFGRITRPLPMPRSRAAPCPIGQRQFDEACTTADQLGSYRVDMPERPSELALHRFGLGCARPDSADGLLDFVIALEALLLPYDREVRFADLSYRFRLHGAHFIAANTDERRSIFRTLSKLYGMRSRLVHGDDYPDATETLAAANDARRLAARGLLKAVRSGFPDVAHLNRLALGEEP